jgi:thymidine phosphorylase
MNNIMKKRNVIIALIVVIAIVLGGLVIWKPSSQVKELINKTEKEGGEQLDEHYAELQAQAALLKAKLAAESKDTYDQAYKNLEEAKRWYRHNNYVASKKLDSTNQKMIEKINEAQEYLKEKKDEAGVLISDIYSKASELVKDDDQ